LEQYDVKITVAKKLSTASVFGRNAPKVSEAVEDVCPRFKEGDTYLSEKGSCPEGFCSWAFADIQRDIAHLRFGGSYPWLQEEGVAYSCCTDGLRPVIFRLERVSPK
jgi:uncharacterized repeat protein (TIGR04076 family)